MTCGAPCAWVIRRTSTRGLPGRGYTPVLLFTKRCENSRVSTTSGRPFPVTLVTVLELYGTLLEVETMADESNVLAALDDVRALLLDLEIGPDGS